ncbi:MAG: bifunctional alpha,alpha-trehalose-phosphate synthase (UDP-forming)/trehalose-phosphatase [candidate division WOR-3 bacterium]|nr:MAG: bifunctional alpha,alpha-trehalose-phosphate synthase (UDP-forming)/trehalose-phosphatase [candidate division WOR-3 bacterium]
MVKLIIVSNRLRVTVAKREGKLRFHASAGGLATGLDSFYKSYNSLWIGWPGIASERIREEKKQIEKKLRSESCYPVFISQHDIDNYYHGFCNKTIWPLFHYFTQYTVYGKNLWESYKRINEHFCHVVTKIAQPNDTIWIHDYQLMLLPQLLRKKNPGATIGFFLHIPFPSSEVFRLLPCRKEIIEGILGADLIGFHTYDYVHHFIESMRRLLGYEHEFDQITTDNRIAKIDAFPMGIEYERFAEAVDDESVQREIKKIRNKVGDRKIILSIDRLDYTKGIPQRLEAFDYFLEKNPHYREKVTLILVAVPSRAGVEHYALLKNRVDELISRINGRYGTIGWMPIWYLYRFLAFKNLVPLYNIADVALITPLRDGMNLIAKEFIATKTDRRGVLVLSEMAGASKELGEAIIVNPNNKEEIAQALKNALTMPESEQMRRNEIMQRRLKRYNVERWAHDFMDRLYHIKKFQQDMVSKKLIPETINTLVKDYARSKRSLIVLDYDGTLIPFSGDPAKVKPDNKLFKLLKTLADNVKNEVIIISGRGKQILETWFKDLPISFIAEHGVWVKEKNEGWELVEPLRNDWKDLIKPILERYVDRTPGSLIEEKEFSLVWHYRKVDPTLALIRAGELKEALLNLIGSLNLGILEGSKIIEIKNVGINKGRAVLKWIPKEKWDFIIAIGDDWTDEDTFAALPDWAYTIKVGLGLTKARFNIDSPAEVRQLLETLVRV